jgi:hypothetical protein
MVRSVAIAAAFGGCVVYEQDAHVDTVPVIAEPLPPAGVVVVDGAPWVDAAAVWVGFDGWQYVVTFEAWVNDPLGPYDVAAVWVDVWDEWAGGFYVASYELMPTTDPAYWTVAWEAGAAGIDPFWGGYTADVVVYDLMGASTWTTVVVDPW